MYLQLLQFLHPGLEPLVIHGLRHHAADSMACRDHLYIRQKDSVNIIGKPYIQSLLSRRTVRNRQGILRQFPVVSGIDMFPLKHREGHLSLMVFRRVKSMDSGTGEHGISGNDRGKIRVAGIAGIFGGCSQRKWADIRQYIVFDRLFPCLNAAEIPQSPDDHFITVQINLRLPVEQMRYIGCDNRHLAGTSCHNNIRQILRAYLGAFHRMVQYLLNLIEDSGAFLHQPAVGIYTGILLPLYPGSHPAFLGVTQFPLAFFRLSFQYRQILFGHITLWNAMLFQKGFHHNLMEIIPSQMVISCHSLNFHHIFKAVHNGYVQSSSSEIKDQKQLLFSVIHIGGQSRGAGLIDQPMDLDSCQKSGLFRGIPLLVVEISRNRNDHFLNLLSQISLGILHNRADHKTGQFLRGKVKASQMKGLLLSHKPLERTGRSFRSGNKPFLCNFTYNDFLVFIYTDYAGRKIGTVAIGNQLNPSIFIYTAQGIGSSQVNA